MSTRVPPVRRFLTSSLLLPCIALLCVPSLHGFQDGTDVRVNQNVSGTQGETAIAVNPLDPDNWVCVAIDLESGVDTGVYTTLDAGETWTAAILPLLPGAFSSGDPVVAFTANGTVHAITMMKFGGQTGIVDYRSLDGGLTWQTPIEIDRQPANEKAQVAADLGAGPHRGDLTVVWTEFQQQVVYSSTSTDSGSTWSPPVAVSDTPDQLLIADVTYGPNSELYVMWNDFQNPMNLWLDVSRDRGQTFGTDLWITTAEKVPMTRYGFRPGAFAVAADATTGPYSGALYVAFHRLDQASNDSLVHCARSFDQGLTWDIRQVSTKPQIQPGITVDSRGNVNLFSYRVRSGSRIEARLARSSNGGAAWSHFDIQDVAAWPTAGNWIGDYPDVDFTDHLVIPCWSDARNGDLDVYLDRVQLDFFADTASLSASTGGTIDFTVNFGPNFGGLDYLLLGSASGTTPGLNFSNGLHLPLNFDALMLMTLVQANSAGLNRSRGTLNGRGNASPLVDSMGPLSPGVIGVDLHFAVLVSGAQPVHVSTPVRVQIVP